MKQNNTQETIALTKSQSKNISFQSDQSFLQLPWEKKCTATALLVFFRRNFESEGIFFQWVEFFSAQFENWERTYSRCFETLESSYIFRIHCRKTWRRLLRKVREFFVETQERTEKLCFFSKEIGSSNVFLSTRRKTFWQPSDIILPQVQQIFTQSQENFISFQKRFLSNFSSGRSKCSFDNPAEKIPLNCQQVFGEKPKKFFYIDVFFEFFLPETFLLDMHKVFLIDVPNFFCSKAVHFLLYFQQNVPTFFSNSCLSWSVRLIKQKEVFTVLSQSEFFSCGLIVFDLFHRGETWKRTNFWPKWSKLLCQRPFVPACIVPKCLHLARTKQKDTVESHTELRLC